MRLKEFIVETPEVLNEIDMSPRSLRQLAAQTGAKAGMEFEMIVPDVQDPDGDDQEPDYDSDDRVSSFSNIEDFFMGGDGNNSRSDVRSLIEGLQENYYEWAGEQRYEQWGEEKYDFFKDYFELHEFDEDGAVEQATEEIKEANPEIPEDSEEFTDAVRERTQEIFDEQLEEAWDDQGRIYDRAREEWEDGADWPDEGDYLSNEGYRWMSDLPYSDYGVYWPYMTSSGGGADIDQVADEFSDMIGKPINASSSYHGARREAGTYVVEPDGSLEADDSDDAGLEFVSPPMPIDEMLSDFNKIVAWAKQKGCYTNDSTGLHMNVSVPNFSRERLDYMKLAILMGDKYILEQYGRAANTYCKSAMNNIRLRVKQRPEDTQALLNQMRAGLSEIATKTIHSGITDKYTSINTKDGYVEFRSPGGDWLDADIPKIENTLLRFVVALDAACDPQKYRQEYLKKLYKLLNPEGATDTYGDMVAEFSKYVTAVGGASKEALRDFRTAALQQLKQDRLARDLKKNPTNGQKYWWNVVWDSNRRMEVVATNAEEAKQVAAKEWGINPQSEAALGFTAKPIKPYDESPVRATVGEPQPVGQQSTGQSHTFRVFSTNGNTTMGSFEAPGPRGSREAQIAYSNFLARMGRSLTDAQGLFDYQEIGRTR